MPCILAAAAVVVAATAAAVIGVGHAVAAATAEQNEQNDDPAAVAAAPGIVIAHNATSYEMWSLGWLSFHGMRAVQKGASNAGNAVAQRQQRVHKMHILEENAGNLCAQLHVGEVPEAADTQFDQMVGNRLCHGLGQRQHGHIRMVLVHICLDLGTVTDLHTVDLRTDQVGREVKGGVNMEANGVEVEVLQQRMTQVTGTDDDDVVAV